VIENLSTVEVEGPSVKRAGNVGAGNDAIGERAPSMWAAVIDGEERVSHIENRDATAGEFDGLALAHGYAVAAGHANPTPFRAHSEPLMG
jgi:hypothetical protein